MEEEIREIAQRISGLRDACGYTQEEFADALGIDRKVYAEYEETGKNIPISVIYDISKKCGVDFAVILTGESANLDKYHVVRAGKGQSIDRYPGYIFKDLAFRFPKKIMQPLLVTIDPSDKTADLVSHKGEEFNYVVEGTIIVTIGDKELTLNAGDSVYFNPTIPHGQRCGCDKPSTFLTVISEV
ncbi:MAG: helix-turn-helix transcriptional regulator [Lachnospiraceae bacterium]|nr:helix-turn-helix transcriptional regulator [Lachnospiraceae bacterium]